MDGSEAYNKGVELYQKYLNYKRDNNSSDIPSGIKRWIDRKFKLFYYHCESNKIDPMIIVKEIRIEENGNV